MEPLVALSGAGNYNLNLGLGRGYDGAGVVQPGTVSISNRHIKLTSQWADKFKNGAYRGVQGMLRSLLAENGGSLPGVVSSQGNVGPTVDAQQFSEKVIVPLLITYSGLVMDTSQLGALQALMTLVSVMHVPEVMPMQACVFKMRFKSTGQTLAERGRMVSKVGGTGSSFFDIDFNMTKYVTGFTIGDKELFYESDPEAVITALAEKVTSLETTWGLTAINMHAEYAAKQPSLQQLMLMNRTLHQPDTNVVAKLMQVFFMEHILCGALNRSDANFAGVLTSITEMLQSESGQIVVIVPKRVMDSGKLALTRKTITVPTRRYVYNANGATGMSTYALFGTTSRDPYADYDAVQSHDAQGEHRRPNNTVTDNGPLAVGGATVEVDCIKLTNGQECNIIAITGGASDTSVACDGALKQRGVKRLFFTVGGCPEAYKKFCNSGYFGREAGASCAQAMSCNPGVTYFMDYDNNKVAKVTMRDIHVRYADADLFDANLALAAWRNTFPTEYVGYVDELDSALLLFATKENRQRSIRLMFETNPRFMMVNSQVNVQAIRTSFPQTNGAYVFYVPRHVMGNASPLHSFESDIVCTVGGLAQMFRDVTPNVNTLMEEMARDLQLVDHNEVLAARRTITFLPGDGTMLAFLRRCVPGTGILSDPFVQVLFLDVMKQCSNQAFLSGVVAAAAADVVLVPQPRNNAELLAHVEINKTYLMEMYNLVSRAYAEIHNMLLTMYDNTDYNLILKSEPLIDCDPAVLAKYPDVVRWMYGIALPSMSNSVVVPVNANATNCLRASLPHFSLRQCAGVFVDDNAAIGGGYIRVPAYAETTDIGIVRPVFATRYVALRKKFACCPMVKALALTHWWTLWNYDTMLGHFDVNYFSGLSYVVVRHMKFTGYTLACLPVQGTRFLTGSRAFGFPVNTWQSTQYNQTMTMGMAPMELASLGITAQNFYIDEISGLGDNFDIAANSHDCALVVDSYNSYLPAGLTSYQPDLGLLSLHGRFDGASDKSSLDGVTGIYSFLPTTFTASSPLLELVRKTQTVVTEDSSMGMMTAAIKTGSFVSGIPSHVYAAAEKGVRMQDVVDRVIQHGEVPPHLFTNKFAGMFTDDYTVGEGSSVQLLGGTPASDFNPELQPRISSIGGINANAVFGQKATDPKFMNAFNKQVEAARLNLGRAF